MSDSAYQAMHTFSISANKHWRDVILTIIVVVAAAVIEKMGKPRTRIFFERDPSLSYPYIASEAVPDWALILAAFITPLVLILAVQYTAVYLFKQYSRFTVDRVVPLMALVQALGFTLFFTDVLKCFLARPRPNFYAMCNYKGYRDAWESGNYTDYDASTVANAIVDVIFCTGSAHDIAESQMSFPSGHSSLSFAGLTTLSLYLYGVLDMGMATRMWKMCLVWLPLCCAATIAASRSRDYYHNYDDIMGGSLIGIVCAAFAYMINFRGVPNKQEPFVPDSPVAPALSP